MEENLKKAEEDFQKAIGVMKQKDEDGRDRADLLISYFTEASYFLLSALYHQNEAMIKLLQKNG